MTPINPRVLESLNWGISAEIKSYVFYTEAARQAAVKDFKDTLLTLAAEEKNHYQILERQHHSLITSERWVSYNDILKQEGLPEINEEMAATHKALLDSVRKAGDQRRILDIAMGLEREAHEMFTQAAGRAVNPDEKKTFEYLANFELGHIRVIQKMIDSL
jgi:rubrerythrin